MAILDTLTIQLGMDGTGLTKGVKEAEANLKKVHEGAEKSTSTLVEAGKKGADTFAAFRQEAMGALALFTGGASTAGLAAFTKSMADANTALGSLSRQLDIAPQKLTQLHEAMKATGGSAGDVDSFFKSLQSKSSTNEGLAQLTRLGQLTGVQFLDQNGKVRADALDQLAHSRTWHSLNRGVQEQYAGQMGLSSAGVNFVDRQDYDQLNRRFSGLGPSAEQIRQGEQLLSDWQELKANTDQVMQQVFSEMEPSIHNFLQAMIALEKSHPHEIAEGVAGVATALTALSALLTAKSFLSSLRLIRGIANLPTAIAGGVGAAVASDVNQNGVSPWDTGAGGMYADQVKNAPPGLSEAATGISDEEARAHYLKRTGDTRYDPQLWFHNWDDERGLMAGDANPDLERLAGAVAMQESGGNPNAVNAKTGAAGMFQFMPGTARENGVANPFDPNQAWAGGLRYLGRLQAKYHDMHRALAAYNWGPGNLDDDLKAHGAQWQSFLPHETSDYLAKVGRNYETGNIVHHNNTTHGPTVNVVVNGGAGSPAEIGRMARQGTAEALQRHETGRVG